MSKLQETPSANRVHIGVFGRTNSGKSSLINRLTNQEVSIVSDISGTTTDPVYKAMEIHPLGPCMIIDTAGYDDQSELGEKRVVKTQLAAEKTDLAVILISAEHALSEKQKIDFREMYSYEKRWYQYFQTKRIPVLFVITKSDLSFSHAKEIEELLKKQFNGIPVRVNAKTGEGIEQMKLRLAGMFPESWGNNEITGKLVSENDLVLLIMPQNIQAPKGRLILPQVQTIRELLDKHCIVISTTTEEMPKALGAMKYPPKLIITDSQEFCSVKQYKPKESLLTSFSVLFAAYKGDLSYYRKSVSAVEKLTTQSKVLIAECCTHAPLQEDIGRVKIPRLLRKKIGEKLSIEIVSGTDFPEDLTPYDLVIQCGGCMFNRTYILSRIERARKQGVPMTNYGVLLASLAGVPLDFKE